MCPARSQESQLLIRPGVQGLFSSNSEPMTEDEPECCSFVKLEPFELPDGWYDDPRNLRVFEIFCPTDGSCLADDFKNDYALPTPHPVLTSGPYFLIDGGNGRCYPWHDKSDCVMELYERNLDNV